MRTFSLLSLSVLTLGLVACSSGTQDAQPEPSEPAAQEESQVPVADSLSSAASSDDHHEGETNVQPHDDSVASAPADHVDDPNEPPHDDSASSHDDSNEPPHRD